jgi:hypothetical protein
MGTWFVSFVSCWYSYEGLVRAGNVPDTAQYCVCVSCVCSVLVVCAYLRYFHAFYSGLPPCKCVEVFGRVPCIIRTRVQRFRDCTCVWWFCVKWHHHIDHDHQCGVGLCGCQHHHQHHYPIGLVVFTWAWLFVRRTAGRTWLLIFVFNTWQVLFERYLCFQRGFPLLGWLCLAFMYYIHWTRVF